MSKLKEKAEKYLKDHPGAEIHGTTDGFLFHRKQDAIAHAATLANKEVVSFGKPASKIEVPSAQTFSGNQVNEMELAAKNAEAEKKAAAKAKTEAAKKQAAEKLEKAEAEKKAEAAEKLETAEAEKEAEPEAEPAPKAKKKKTTKK